MSKEIAVLITDEFENSEFTSPTDEFHRAGHGVIIIEKQAGKTVKGEKGEASMTIGKSIDEVTPAEFGAPLLPGDHSPNYLRGGNCFVTFTCGFVNNDKPVFTICHGPQLLISANVIRRRKLTTVKPIIIDVKNVGAEFYDQEVVVDKDQLVTSQTPGDLPASSREALRLLGARVAQPNHFFTKARRAVGEFGFIEPDFSRRGRQYSDNREATIVRFAREIAFLTFQPVDLTSKLHTAN